MEHATAQLEEGREQNESADQAAIEPELWVHVLICFDVELEVKSTPAAGTSDAGVVKA